MKLIIGLGNPGEKYKNTRHNLGFKVVEELVSNAKHPTGQKASQTSWEESKKFKSLVAKVDDVIFAKPQTCMNNSGLVVSAAAEYFKISPENIIVIHDDLDLPLGRIKIRKGGSAAGHHGVESVIEKLKDEQFIRVRLGIGPEKKDGHFNAEQFVLQKFLPKEKPEVKKMIAKAAEAIELLLKEGLEAAQNQYN